MGALSSTCIFAFTCNYEIHPKGGVGTLSRDYGISVVHTLGYMYMYIHGWVYVLYMYTVGHWVKGMDVVC